MPLQRCQSEGLPGWKWGKSGKCYTGGNAKARAAKQARAIRASGFTGNVDSHRGVRTRVVPSNPLKADPTRSATLRRIFETDLTRRFFALKSKILRLIVDEDAFGLRQSSLPVLFNKEQNDGKSNESGRGIGSTSDLPELQGGDNLCGALLETHQVNSASSDTPDSRGIPTSNRDCSEGLTTTENGREQSDGGTLQFDGDNGGHRRTQAKVALPGDSAKQGRREVGQVVERASSKTPSKVVTNQRWAGLTDPRKVQEFQRWLATQIQTDIIEEEEETLDQAYWQKYVEEGYRKGAGRAFDDTRKVALSSDASGVSDFYRGTREEFLRSAFAQPVAIEKVQLLTSRVFTDLKGVTEAMSVQMARALADGLVQGDNPRKIARDMVGPGSPLEKIGKRRAQLIARTEIIRAHAEGQLDAFENLGVENVGVAAEWSTAGDDRVCPLCQPLEGTVMPVKEARGLLPRHVQCRCAWIPANVGEDKTEKTRVRFKDPKTGEIKTTFISKSRSKAEVQKSISDSIRAEIPKRQVGKRTLAQQKARTPWRGADKAISKKRPKGILEAPEPVKKVRPRKVTPTPVKPRKVAPSVTSSPEFKRWFGKSKVVDKQGKPVKMFRGTSGESLGAHRGPESGNLIFLTPEEEFAKRYAAQFPNGKVHKVFVKSEDLIDISHGDGFQIWKKYRNEMDVPSYAATSTKDGLAVSWQHEQPFRKWLAKNNIKHDGIYFAENDGSRSLAVRVVGQLSPTNVKPK